MDQSTALHLFRGFAALVVVFGHVRNELFPDYKAVADPALWLHGIAFLGGFGGQAVILFFVMSGWLVGGRFLKSWPHTGADYAGYAIDRVTRLWAVLIPVFVLHLGFYHLWIYRHWMQYEFELSALVGNLFGLQTIYYVPFGGNYPLWSLANETAYYVLFPLLLAAANVRLSVVIRLGALAIALAYASILPRSILLYFAIWIVGSVACLVPFKRTRLVYLAVPLLLLCSFASRALRLDTNFLMALSLAVLFALCIWSIEPGKPSHGLVRKAAVLLASFSFTLYVAHVPLTQAFTHLGLMSREWAGPSQWHGLLYFLAVLAAVVLASYLVYLLGEAHTLRIRDRIKALAGIR